MEGKQFNFCSELVCVLCEKFRCSHEDVAKFEGKFESQAKISKVDLDMFKYRSPAEAGWGRERR